jgi:tetratricopeptide (TPR) repeat protein
VARATDFERRHPSDRRAARLVANSNFFLAWALPPADSIPVWEHTLGYYEDELRRIPDSVEVQRNAALMSKYLASALNNLGRRAESEKHYRRALELDEARLRAAPGDRQTRLDVAISYGSMGEFLLNGGNQAEAADLYARSVDLRRRVVDADPKDVQARERLAYGLMMLGQVRGGLGQTAEARALLREAIDVQDRVLAVTGDNSGRRQLANAWFEMGTLEESARARPAACAAYRRARDLFAGAASALVDAEKSRMQMTAAKMADNCR